MDSESQRFFQQPGENMRIHESEPDLSVFHPKFLKMCERHGLKPGYALTNQVMDMFAAIDGRRRYQNWDQITGTVSFITFLVDFIMSLL